MKTAIVSGASRGIGSAIAEKLAGNGWSLGLLARSADEMSKSAGEIQSRFGVQTHVSACDVSMPDDVVAAFSTVEESLGVVDLVVCNAGVGKFALATETGADDWDLQMDVNAKGSFLLAKEASRRMIERGNGQIIFIASDASRRTFSNGTSYCASKFAQYGLASALRHELRPHGVRVSVVMPGLVASYFNDGDPESADKATWLKPDDVADAVAYIASTPPNVVIDELVLHPISQDW